MSGAKYVYAYCHGFASNAASYKGVELARRLAAKKGVTLQLPDLNNGPDYSTVSYSGMLSALEKLDEDARQKYGQDCKWRFIGSSLGGYMAARFAQVHPDRVDRLLLLCPGFKLLDRWPRLFGRETMDEWKEKGYLPHTSPRGMQVNVPYTFIEDCMKHPPVPTWTQPTLIIHGSKDDIVPIENSQEVASRCSNVRLVVVDDDHALTLPSTLDLIEENVCKYFDL